jgi:hypothetical protein
VGELGSEEVTSSNHSKGLSFEGVLRLNELNQLARSSNLNMPSPIRLRSRNKRIQISISLKLNKVKPSP